MPSPIWVLMYGFSSAGKTPILKSVTKLVDPYDAAQSREFIAASKVYESQMAEYRNAKKKQKKADGKNAIDAEFDPDTEPEPPEKPFNGSFIAENATIEGVRKKMDSNGGYVFVCDDEFKGFMGAFNQYNSGKGVDVNFWNKTYNGETGRVLRASMDELVIPNATASMCGGIQTPIFEGKDFLSNEEYRTNGFLARYLIVGIEDRPIDQDRPKIPECVKNGMNRVMEHLFNMRWSGDIFGEKPRSNHYDPVMIDMEDEALQLFWTDKKFYDQWKGSRANDVFSSMIGKFEGYTARIALVLHCLKGEPWDANGGVGRVDQATIKAAIRINFWCAREWYRTFFGLKKNLTELAELRMEEEQLIQKIEECGGIPKHALARGTSLTSDQRRMIKNLLSRGLLVERGQKAQSGQTAKYIVVKD